MIVSKLSRIAPGVAIACLLTGISAPAAANTILISRCNEGAEPFPPAMHIIDGSNRYTISLGEAGLTRNDVYSEGRAYTWAAGSGLFPEGSQFGGYAGVICGIPVPESEPVAEEAPQDDCVPSNLNDFCGQIDIPD